MIPRYENTDIRDIFSYQRKLAGWQAVELAVILARVDLGLIPRATYDTINECLTANEPDIAWWQAEDKRISHDLNAFINERRRFLPAELQHEFHKDMTSYDTEEAAFARQLSDGAELVERALAEFSQVLLTQATKHQHTIMLARTHGQAAKLRSFGSHVLTWHQELSAPAAMFAHARNHTTVSRLSGAVGNYGGNMTPDIERTALAHLGLEPFYGATQIMPRTIYAPLAQSMLLICEAVGKIALDVRLGARSGMPIVQEPFGKEQMGSSAMPHKKNTITTEQMAGMVRLARGYTLAITSNCETWEARAIEQSSVERVAWPDLFHVTLRTLSAMKRIIGELQVFPDRMLEEVVASRGTYASDEAKNLLAEECGKRGISAETAYRIIQLASFNVFAPTKLARQMRDEPCETLYGADARLEVMSRADVRLPEQYTLQDLIPMGKLFSVEGLQASPGQVADWNELLKSIFRDQLVGERWDEQFKPSHLLAQEQALFKALLPSPT